MCDPIPNVPKPPAVAWGSPLLASCRPTLCSWQWCNCPCHIGMWDWQGMPKGFAWNIWWWTVHLSGHHEDRHGQEVVLLHKTRSHVWAAAWTRRHVYLVKIGRDILKRSGLSCATVCYCQHATFMPDCDKRMICRCQFRQWQPVLSQVCMSVWVVQASGLRHQFFYSPIYQDSWFLKHIAHWQIKSWWLPINHFTTL